MNTQEQAAALDKIKQLEKTVDMLHQRCDRLESQAAVAKAQAEQVMAANAGNMRREKSLRKNLAASEDTLRKERDVYAHQRDLFNARLDELTAKVADRDSRIAKMLSGRPSIVEAAVAAVKKVRTKKQVAK